MKEVIYVVELGNTHEFELLRQKNNQIQHLNDILHKRMEEVNLHLSAILTLRKELNEVDEEVIQLMKENVSLSKKLRLLKKRIKIYRRKPKSLLFRW